MEIKIYGAEGCAKCSNLKEKTEEVVEEEEVIDADVEKVNDTVELAEKGVMSTPAFEVDDEIVFSGSNPPKKEIARILRDKV